MIISQPITNIICLLPIVALNAFTYHSATEDSLLDVSPGALKFSRSLKADSDDKPRRQPTASSLPSLETGRWRKDAMSKIHCCPSDSVLLLADSEVGAKCAALTELERNSGLVDLEEDIDEVTWSLGLTTAVECSAGHFWLDRGEADDAFSVSGGGELNWRGTRWPVGGYCVGWLLERAADIPASNTATTLEKASVTSLTLDSEATAAQSPIKEASETFRHRPLRLRQVAKVCYPRLNYTTAPRNIVGNRCTNKVCSRKCCPPGLRIRRSDMRCVPLPHRRLSQWQPTFYDGERAAELGEDDGDVVLMPGLPECKRDDGTKRGVFPLEPEVMGELDRFFLQRDGRLLFAEHQMMIDPWDFCVDRVQYDRSPEPTQDTSTTETLSEYMEPMKTSRTNVGQPPGKTTLRDNGSDLYLETRPNRKDEDYEVTPIPEPFISAELNASEPLLAVVCFPEQPAFSMSITNVLMLVSSAALLVTLMVYALVPSLRNLHGCCLMAHVTSLLTSFVCRVVVTLPAVYTRLVSCLVTGEFLHTVARLEIWKGEGG